MRRRHFVAGITCAAIAAGSAADAQTRLAALETKSNGRLGVFARDSGTHRMLAYRETERFPMCSTFKVVAVAAVLARVDRKHERLDRRIAFGRRDLLDYAPVTSANVGTGAMTVAALCAAAIELSDNTAANLLLRSVGGPAAVTRFARSIGDSMTRLDRIEPDVNTALPGDARDTTTPAAMVATLAAITTGDALSAHGSSLLRGWLERSQTGKARLRAGLPRRWRCGDKTGSGAHGTANDVALVWPPARPPIVVAAFLSGALIPLAQREAVLADVGTLVGAYFGGA